MAHVSRKTQSVAGRPAVRPTPLTLALMAAILCAGIAARIGNLSNVTSRTPDERVYTQQAKVWLEKGPAGVHELVQQYQRDPVVRQYPAPTRVGMIRLTAAAMEITGDPPEAAGAVFACVASIGSLLLAAALGLRFLPWPAALFGLLFYAVSPMELAIARRTWTDAITEVLAVALIYVAAEITRDSRRRFLYPLFAALGALGIPIKESTPAAYGLCAIWLMWVLLKERREWRNAAILAGCAVAFAAAVALWMAASGVSVSDWVSQAAGVGGANAVNAYAIEYATAPAYVLLELFWIMTPVAAALCLAGLWTAFEWRRRPSPDRQVFWMALVMLAYMALPMVLPHWMNLRYVAAIFVPFYLLAGLGFWRLSERCANWLESSDRRAFATALAAAALIAAIMDYARFERVFVRGNTADLSAKMIIDSPNLP